MSANPVLVTASTRQDWIRNRNAQIRADRESGLSIEELMEKYQVCRRTVYNALSGEPKP